MFRERLTTHCRVLAFVASAFLAAPLTEAATAPTTANPLQPFETSAAQALLIDADTETVLFAKAPDDRFAPAGLTKLMTMAVVFDALKAGQLHLTDTFTVSENAWKKGGTLSGGTTMFAKLGSSIKVSDLLRGAIVQSGNDACIVFAEGMAGSEAAFADRMNAEAKKLGLTGSHFTNATGLSDPSQYVTARDLATLARHLIADFPDYYPIYAETAFTWGTIRQENRNPLLAMNIGADGLSTGGGDQTGYQLVGSAVRDGERLIEVVAGASSDKVRADEARKLLDWGFRSFQKTTVLAAGASVGEAAVFGGSKATVSLSTREAVDAFLPRGAHGVVEGRVIYQGPVRAPIAKGQLIGNVELRIAGTLIREAPVYAADDVAVGSLPQRAFDGLRELATGWW